jgi:hypothetical protein
MAPHTKDGSLDLAFSLAKELETPPVKPAVERVALEKEVMEAQVAAAEAPFRAKRGSMASISAA